MRRVTATLESIGAYQQSKHHETPIPKKKNRDDHERDTWRERCHYLSDGTIFIPAIQFRNSLSGIAQYLGEKIQGKGSHTWSKHFLSGIRVATDLVLPVKKDEVECFPQFCNSKGNRGQPGSKVKKYFPLIRKWKGDVEYVLLDDLISEEIFERYLREAGALIGIGKERPQLGGDFGRYQVMKLVWA